MIVHEQNPPASAKLAARMQWARPKLGWVQARLWSVPHPEELYPEYLCLTHHILRASVAVMEASRARCRERSPADPVSHALIPYWDRHVEEETGHDEWVRQDLLAIGLDPDEPLRRLPGAGVASMVGAQYYWIEHHHPVALIGYVYLLEGTPPSVDVAERLSRATGYPIDGFRTLDRHAAADVGHIADLVNLVDSLPLQPSHQEAICLSALHTARCLVDIFGRLADRFSDPAERHKVPARP